MTDPIQDILHERERQISVEGFDTETHGRHTEGRLSKAAACYLLIDSNLRGAIANLWPFHRLWWKPTDKRRNLVKAGALIVAEIERLDRIEKARNANTPKRGPPEAQVTNPPPMPTNWQDGQNYNVIVGVFDGKAQEFEGTIRRTQAPDPKTARPDGVKRGQKGLRSGTDRPPPHLIQALIDAIMPGVVAAIIAKRGR